MSTIKTAVSLDSRLYSKADKVAQEMSISRSRLFGLALEAYLERRDAVDLARSYNEAYSEPLDEEEQESLRCAEEAHWAALEPEEW
jgi:metal-responsive CopG/Arc/MetJ family transcriptional regulator